MLQIFWIVMQWFSNNDLVIDVQYCSDAVVMMLMILQKLSCDCIAKIKSYWIDTIEKILCNYVAMKLQHCCDYDLWKLLRYCSDVAFMIYQKYCKYFAMVSNDRWVYAIKLHMYTKVVQFNCKDVTVLFAMM